ncbi:MAG: zinc-binding dehydrogenase [Saprospiraceae bacterium]|nr:zinc-binding dehydrogenase [Saprospiraceae bacterium]
MKALVLEGIGDELRIKEVPDLHQQEGYSIVQIETAALNHRDVWITKGKYPKLQFPLIMGSDGAGYLDGNPVLINPSLNWGENPAVQAKDYRILGMPDQGTYAEAVNIPSRLVHSVPEHLTMEEAAAVPLAGLTAYRALMVKCKPQPGDKVLISGIGGGVALFAFQFALAHECDVYVTSGSDEKIQQSIALGASGGVNYTDAQFPEKLADLCGGFDVIIDSAAGSGFTNLLKNCKPGGRISFYGGTQGNIPELNPQFLFWRQISIFGSTMGTDSEFIEMLQFIKIHKIHPILDSIYPIEEANEAFQRMAEGKQFGKNRP